MEENIPVHQLPVVYTVPGMDDVQHQRDIVYKTDNGEELLDSFVSRALDSNIPLELMNHPQGRHGFDILDDDTRCSRSLLERWIL